MTPPTITPGTYRHFKGNNYEVFGVAQLVDTDDHFVVYRPLYGDNPRLILRRFAEFTGTVDRDGRVQPRFVLVEAKAGIAG